MSPTLPSSGYASTPPIAWTAATSPMIPAGEIEVVDAHVDDQAAAAASDWRTRPTAGYGSREVDLNTTGIADGALVEPPLRCREAAIEAAHEAHLKEHAGRARPLAFIASASSSEMATAAFRRISPCPPRPPPRPCSRACDVGVTMTTASTDGSSKIAQRIGRSDARTPNSRATSSTAAASTSATAVSRVHGIRVARSRA